MSFLSQLLSSLHWLTQGDGRTPRHQDTDIGTDPDTHTSTQTHHISTQLHASYEERLYLSTYLKRKATSNHNLDPNPREPSHCCYRAGLRALVADLSSFYVSSADGALCNVIP